MSFRYSLLLAGVITTLLSLPVLADHAMESPEQSNGNNMQQTTTESNGNTTQASDTKAMHKINLNQATIAQFKKAGFSLSQARAIVSYRKKHGSFSTVDELKKVHGFKRLSRHAFNKLADKVSVDESTGANENTNNTSE